MVLDPPHLIGLDCGSVKDVYTTVDFGVSTDPGDAFRHMRLFSPRGPLVNSEFYPGWLDFWGVAHQKVSTDDVLKSLDAMLKLKANVNFYMYHGGTNFGFSNGILLSYYCSLWFSFKSFFIAKRC